MKYGRNEYGFIIAEHQAAQWLGDDAEFLTDWGFAFDPSVALTRAQLDKAIAARHSAWSVVDGVPTNGRGGIPCAAQPSSNHVLGDNWSTDPLNPSVCWRLKTSQELDAESTAEANQTFDLTAKDKTILKQLFLVRKQLNPALTLAQFRAELISDYKSFK